MKASINQQNTFFNQARVAGFLYLLIAIIGGFSIGYVPSQIINFSDAENTVLNLLDNSKLFKLGIIADVFVFLTEIVLTIILYQIFKKINNTLSLIALLSRFGMSVIMGINLILYLAPWFLANQGINGLDPEVSSKLIMLFFKLHDYGISLWGMFFALHLLVLGHMIMKSSYAPKILGWLMFIGSFGYGLDSLLNIVYPSNPVLSSIAAILLVLAVAGELGFTFWLIIKGKSND